jgi:hypothetical protein
MDDAGDLRIRLAAFGWLAEQVDRHPDGLPRALLEKGFVSRVRYTAEVVREAERMGWSWSYWQFDSDFIAFDMGRGCGWSPFSAP